MVSKIYLQECDKPTDISKHFPQYTHNELLLQYLENKDKLLSREEIVVKPEQEIAKDDSNPEIADVIKNELEEAEHVEECKPIRDDFDFNVDDEESRKEQDREELLIKLRHMEKQYRDSNITIEPFTDYTSMKDLEQIYKRTVRETLYESNLENLHKYISYFFMGTEWIGTQWLHLELSGFTEYQLTREMGKYNKILHEISERNYLSWSQGLAPEFKLLVLFVTQLGMFLLMKNTPSLTNLLHNFKLPNTKMKGPSNA